VPRLQPDKQQKEAQDGAGGARAQSARDRR
jgi:hypothetical protein